jgi:hypothetical protein
MLVGWREQSIDSFIRVAVEVPAQGSDVVFNLLILVPWT